MHLSNKSRISYGLSSLYRNKFMTFSIEGYSFGEYLEGCHWQVVSPSF